MAMSVTYTNFGGQIVSENRGGTKRDYVSDTLGSTIALMDDTGAVTDTWEYWPYGEVSSRTGTTPTPFTFDIYLRCRRASSHSPREWWFTSDVRLGRLGLPRRGALRWL